jgi:hypothetical protein
MLSTRNDTISLLSLLDEKCDSRLAESGHVSTTSKEEPIMVTESETHQGHTNDEGHQLMAAAVDIHYLSCSPGR